jgi:hypothetical protein
MAVISSSGALLGQVAGRAVAEGADGVFVLAVHAQDEHRHIAPLVLELREELEAAAVGQGEVEDHDVPVCVARELQGRGGRRRLTDPGQPVVLQEDLPDALTEDGVIVNAEDAHGRPGLSSAEA